MQRLSIALKLFIFPILVISSMSMCATSSYTMKTSAQDYFNLGEILIQQGKYDNAIKNFREAIRMNPNYADAFRRRGDAYYLNGNNSLAVIDYTMAIKLNPFDSRAHNNRGMVFRLNGYLEQAVDDYTISISLEPYYQSYYNRGLVYLELGNNALAVEDFTEVIKLRPIENPLDYAYRGLAFKRLELKKLAVDDFEKAYSLDPSLEWVEIELLDIKSTNEIRISVNGEVIAFEHLLFHQNNIIFAPISPIMNKVAGFEGVWKEDAQGISVSFRNIKIDVAVDDQIMTVYNKVTRSTEQVVLPVPAIPKIINTIAYWPVEIIFRRLGFTAQWNDANAVLYLYTSN